MECDFSLWLFSPFHFCSTNFCSHRFLVLKCQSLRLKNTQKLISMDKLCGQRVWANRFSAQKTHIHKKRMTCIFRSWTVPRSCVSWVPTSSQKNTLKVNNFIYVEPNNPEWILQKNQTRSHYALNIALWRSQAPVGSLANTLFCLQVRRKEIFPSCFVFDG